MPKSSSKFSGANRIRFRSKHIVPPRGGSFLSQTLCLCYNLFMAKRMAVNTRNKTSRSKKTKKRLLAKYAKKATKSKKVR